MLLLKILGGVLALALGVWLGLPGRYQQDVSEIDERLGSRGRRRRAKRHFTPLAWFQRKASASDSRSRRRIRIVSPDEDDRELKAKLWKS